MHTSQLVVTLNVGVHISVEHLTPACSLRCACGEALAGEQMYGAGNIRLQISGYIYVDVVR